MNQKLSYDYDNRQMAITVYENNTEVEKLIYKYKQVNIRTFCFKITLIISQTEVFKTCPKTNQSRRPREPGSCLARSS